MKALGKIARPVVRAWLIAGTLDITAASVYYPLVYKFKLILLYQNIASGIFGDNAFRGGIPMAALGLLLHYLIALSWTIVFFFLYPRIKMMSKNKFATGMTYGIFVWAVMNLIVLPLSNVEHSSFNIGRALVAALFLVFCIGLPISIVATKFYSEI